MKTTIIILSIIIAIVFIYFMFFRKKCENCNISKILETKKECSAINLAQPPSDKQWVCDNGTWILISK